MAAFRFFSRSVCKCLSYPVAATCNCVVVGYVVDELSCSSRYINAATADNYRLCKPYCLLEALQEICNPRMVSLQVTTKRGTFVVKLAKSFLRELFHAVTIGR